MLRIQMKSDDIGSLEVLIRFQIKILCLGNLTLDFCFNFINLFRQHVQNIFCIVLTKQFEILFALDFRVSGKSFFLQALGQFTGIKTEIHFDAIIINRKDA